MTMKNTNTLTRKQLRTIISEAVAHDNARIAAKRIVSALMKAVSGEPTRHLIDDYRADKIVDYAYDDLKALRRGVDPIDVAYLARSMLPASFHKRFDPSVDVDAIVDAIAVQLADWRDLE